MSPSQRRKDLWKKSVRKQRKRLQKRFGGTREGHYTVVFGLTEDIQMVYVEVFSTFARSGKVYLPKTLTEHTTGVIVDAMVVEALQESY